MKFNPRHFRNYKKANAYVHRKGVAISYAELYSERSNVGVCQSGIWQSQSASVHVYGSPPCGTRGFAQKVFQLRTIKPLAKPMRIQTEKARCSTAPNNHRPPQSGGGQGASPLAPLVRSGDPSCCSCRGDRLPSRKGVPTAGRRRPSGATAIFCASPTNTRRTIRPRKAITPAECIS